MCPSQRSACLEKDMSISQSTLTLTRTKPPPYFSMAVDNHQSRQSGRDNQRAKTCCTTRGDKMRSWWELGWQLQSQSQTPSKPWHRLEVWVHLLQLRVV